MFPEIFRLQKPDIHTAAGQRQTRRTLKALESGMKAQRRHLKKQGLTAEEIQRGMDPTECFHYDLEWQVKTYERAKKGIIYPQTSLEYIGHPLIMARIARGWSRKTLSKKLKVSEQDIVHYERNDYHLVPIDTILKVAALLRIQFEVNVRLLKNGEESTDTYALQYRQTAERSRKAPSKKS